MKTKFFSGLIVFILLSLNCLSQIKVKNITFKVEKPNRYKFDSLLYDGITQEFQYQRVFLNDSVFMENNLLGSSDTFKISATKWEILNHKKWELFHSSVVWRKNILKWGSYYLIPIGKYYHQGITVFKYVLSYEKFLRKGDTPLVLHFNITYGIFKIDYVDFSLLRTDIDW